MTHELEWKRLDDVVLENGEEEIKLCECKDYTHLVILRGRRTPFWLNDPKNLEWAGRCDGWGDIMVRPLPPGTVVNLTQPKRRKRNEP